MPNVYKIDHNSYPSVVFPYALFVQQKKIWGLRTKWEFLGSFETVEQAMAVFKKIENMPIMLGEK